MKACHAQDFALQQKEAKNNCRVGNVAHLSEQQSLDDANSICSVAGFIGFT
jgi:hypothetical protein